MYVYKLPEIKHIDGIKYIIYGVGKAAVDYCVQIEDTYGEGNMELFIETIPRRTTFLGKLVASPDILDSMNVNQYKYIITSFISKDAMINVLKSKGVEEKNIIVRDEDGYTSRLHEDLFKVGQIKNIVIYPKIKTYEKLDEIIKNINWFIPESNFLKIDIKIYSDLSYSFENTQNISLVSDDSIESNIQHSDITLVYDKKTLLDDIIKKNKNKVHCVDETFFYRNSLSVWSKLNYTCLDESRKKYFNEISKRNYSEMLNKNKNIKKAYIFGTGPSLEEAFNFDFKDGYSIICNGISTNEELLKHIQPNAMTLIDDSLYNNDSTRISFVQKAIEFAEKYKIYFITREYHVPRIVTQYPQIAEYIIGMPERNNYKGINFPSTDKFYTKSIAHSNVLTSMMLPIASFVSNDIFILGCDGDAPIEERRSIDGFNHYNDLAFYSESKSYQTEDRDWDIIDGDYHHNHKNFIEKIISYGEEQGKIYRSLTSSYIPALYKRKYDV